MAQGYFITGTDTGVGKTLVSRILIQCLLQSHARVVGFKPVASGCRNTPAGLRNDDAVALQAAGSVAVPYTTVNPYAFEAAIAPHIAAAASNTRIDLARICATLNSVVADRLVVEGVGGWLVPLTPQETMADLAQRLQLPVVLVVGMRLGCLNHALLTAAAIRSSGLPIAGWVANEIDPNFERCDENIATLEDRLDAPLMMRLPWSAQPDSFESLVTRCQLPAMD